MKKIIILSLAIVSTLNMLGEQLQFDGIYYNILSDSTLEVATQPICSSPNDCLTYANIPSVIKYNGKTYDVVGIADAAFYEYPTLKYLTISSSVMSIGTGAFYACPLTTVISKALTLPTLGENVFLECPLASAILYVPNEALMDYKSAEQWKEFGTILPIDSIAVDKNRFPILSGLQRTSCMEYTLACDYENTLDRMHNEANIVSWKDNIYLRYGSFWLREEDDKILVCSVPGEKDLVLYDFTLEVGDTLTTINIIPKYFSEGVDVVDQPVRDYYNKPTGATPTMIPIDTLIVTEISRVTLFDGKEYKKWTFNNGMEYVEGIGSLSGDFFQLINRKRFNTCPHTNHLVCASQNGQLLYQMDNAYMEQLGVECLCEIDEDIKTSVKSIVTPTTSVHKTLQDGRLLIYAGDKTYNVMGVEMGK
jgi:hypothetical protein